MIQSSSTLEIAAPLWLILLITSLRVATVLFVAFFPWTPPKKGRGPRAITVFVITKVSCLGTAAPASLDTVMLDQSQFYICAVVVCTLFSGGGRELGGSAEQHVPLLELVPNESLKSPQSKGSCPHPHCFSRVIQLSPYLTTRWSSSPCSPPSPTCSSATTSCCQRGTQALAPTYSGYLGSHMTHLPRVPRLPAFSQSALYLHILASAHMV